MRQLPNPSPLSQVLQGPLISDDPFERYEMHSVEDAAAAHGAVRAALVLAGVDRHARIFAAPGRDAAFVVAALMPNGRVEHTSFQRRDRQIVTTGLVGQTYAAAVAVGTALIVVEEPVVTHAMRALVNALHRDQAGDEQIGRLATAAGAALIEAVDTELDDSPLWFCAASVDRNEMDEASQPLIIDLGSRLSDPAFYTPAADAERRAIREQLGLASPS